MSSVLQLICITYRGKGIGIVEFNNNRQSGSNDVSDENESVYTKLEEEFVIASADRIADPGAVVVHLCYASFRGQFPHLKFSRLTYWSLNHDEYDLAL